MAKFKKGVEVRKVVPDIIGVVVDARLNADMEIEYLVDYADAQGANQQRWFKEGELQSEPVSQ